MYFNHIYIYIIYISKLSRRGDGNNFSPDPYHSIEPNMLYFQPSIQSCFPNTHFYPEKHSNGINIDKSFYVICTKFSMIRRLEMIILMYNLIINIVLIL